MGQAGNDTYFFRGSFGNDLVENTDSNTASLDLAVFEGLSYEDLWFVHSGNNLTIYAVGSNNVVTFQHWYANDSHQIDRIEADDWFLEREDIEQLVTAMSAYDTPSGDGNMVTTEAIGVLQPIWDDVWQMI